MFQHRRYSPDVLFEVSQRTNRGECLIDCDDPAVRSAIDGILAKAQEKYGVTIYAYHFLANHYHRNRTLILFSVLCNYYAFQQVQHPN